MLGPNTGQWGNEYHEDSIRETTDTVDKHLREPESELMVRRGCLVFNDDAMHGNSDRPGYHTMWIAVNSARDPTTELLRSRWTASDLWKRSSVTNVPLKGIRSYTDPTKGNFRRADTTGASLGKAQQKRMELSGPGFIEAIRKQAWSGMGLTPQDRAAWVELCPFTSDGPEAIMAAGQG